MRMKYSWHRFKQCRVHKPTVLVTFTAFGDHFPQLCIVHRMRRPQNVVLDAFFESVGKILAVTIAAHDVSSFKTWKGCINAAKTNIRFDFRSPPHIFPPDNAPFEVKLRWHDCDKLAICKCIDCSFIRI
jgi:hypothetical protein